MRQPQPHNPRLSNDAHTVTPQFLARLQKMNGKEDDYIINCPLFDPPLLLLAGKSMFYQDITNHQCKSSPRRRSELAAAFSTWPKKKTWELARPLENS